MKLSDDVLFCECGGRQFLISSSGRRDRPAMVRLNGVAAFLAKAMQVDIKKDELLRLVLEQYEVSRREAEESIRYLEEELKKCGFLAENEE